MENLDATNIEKSILGSIIVDNSLGYKLDELNENIFGMDYNKHIFIVMKDLYKNKMTLDLETIKLKLNEKFINIEVTYLSELASMGLSYAIDTHISILKERYIKKSVIKNCTNLIEEIVKGKDINTSLYKFENKTQDILKDKDYEDDNISCICEKILNFLENNDEVGTKFGVELLDDTIGGLFKGELTTIAARSGVGKTALALQIMLNVVAQDKKVLFISREMSNEQIFMRNITKRTGISTKKMKYKDLSENDWKSIINTMGEFSTKNLIYINDKISTVSEIKKRIRIIKPDLVIVDYIQLLSTKDNYQNREREVASLSRELKNITLDFNIPVIQLSQLNDEMKDLRPWGERPMRDSKAIFHDSNNVIYIHEPVGSDLDEAIENIKSDKRKVLLAKKLGTKLVDLIVAKCRDGEVKYKHYCYHGPRLHFQEIKY